MLLPLVALDVAVAGAIVLLEAAVVEETTVDFVAVTVIVKLDVAVPTISH